MSNKKKKKGPSKYHITITGDSSYGVKSFRVSALLLRLSVSGLVFIFLTSILLIVFSGKIMRKGSGYELLEKQYDSLVTVVTELDSIRTNLLKADKYYRFIREVAKNDGKKVLPSLEEYLSSDSLKENLVQKSINSDFQYTPSVKPVNGIISRKFNSSENHYAIDISAAEGTIIKAPAKGVVSDIRFDKYLGNVIELTHGEEYKTLFAHCKTIIAKKNSIVERGEVIAEVGTSGEHSTGSHLHYEVFFNGKQINPENFFE